MPARAWPRCRRLARAAALAALPLGAAAALPAQNAAQHMRDLEARARQDSCQARALYNLAVAYAGARRYDEADSLLKRATTIDPRFAEGFFGLGLVQDRNDRYWDRIKRAGGDSAVARERERRFLFTRKAFLVDPYVDVRLMGSVMRRRNNGDFFGRIMTAFADGDYGTAYGMTDMVYQSFSYRYVTDSLPSGLLWMHALTAARVNQYRVAITDMQALLRQSLAHEREDDSTHFVPLATNEFRYMLASLHQRASQNTLAIDLFRQVLENDVGNYMAHVQMARIHEAEKDWVNAIHEWQAAVEVNPEDHTLLSDLGVALGNAHRWTEAEDALQRAVAMEPRYWRSHFALAIAEQELGKNDQARQAYVRFISLAGSENQDLVEEAQRRLAQLH